MGAAGQVSEGEHALCELCAQRKEALTGADRWERELPGEGTGEEPIRMRQARAGSQEVLRYNGEFDPGSG